MVANHNDIEKRLWGAADELRANSKLKASEYSAPVLGLIFLRYADYRFGLVGQELKGAASGRRTVGKIDYQARGALYLREEARFSNLLRLPEGADVGKAINSAMEAIEADNEELRGVLPKNYARFEKSTLVELLRTFADIRMELQGDSFGKIYEYFLGKFAMSEGQKGGEFFTPTSLVRLIVEVIEPYHGLVLDPACGSGGMFVQSARFVERHRKDPNAEISIYGQERVSETVRLCRMNLAVHGLSGDIREGNSYYDDLHDSPGKFDYVMANPPFNVDRIDKERIKDDTRRFPLGMPKADNGNYLWIQLFYSALNERGRAGFVMANSASDARGSELEIRKKLIEAGVVDVMVAIGPNFFYTVTLPCTLWFLDRGKGRTPRKDQVLFIDARPIFTQVDRAHREFGDAQLRFIADIVRLYRGEAAEAAHEEPSSATATAAQASLWSEETAPLARAAEAPVGYAASNGQANGDSDKWELAARFPDGKYRDVPGLCRVATVAEIEAQGWSLNPGRYVGMVKRGEEDTDFRERLEELNEELEALNGEARQLEENIGQSVARLLGERL